MISQDLVLNIAVNLSRVSRWAQEGKVSRINQFLEETENYLSELQKSPKSERFERTFNNFQEKFKKLKMAKDYDLEWADDALTWSNILIHRAKLA